MNPTRTRLRPSVAQLLRIAAMGAVVAGPMFDLPLLGQTVPAPANREFIPGAWNRLAELPDGPFRRGLEGLPDAARGRALEQLRRFHFTAEDLKSLRTDRGGAVYYADAFPVPGAIPEAVPPPGTAATATVLPVSPFPEQLVFHSRPGSPNVLYLNFGGETVTGTFWNTDLGRTQIPALPFSTDADTATFSVSEQEAIRRIWQRVAEDYAPFDIDVTTARPALFNNRTAHLLVTRNTDANGAVNPASGSGGVAYVDVFGRSGYASYRPAWVYANNLGGNEAHIAEAASHEVGHNLGLSHDGTTDGSEYYGGHGSGETSWGPLMGAPYGRNVTQWARGGYRLANNTQDDLAIIAAKVAYRSDDHGNTPGGATPLVVGADGSVVSTVPEGDPGGTTEENKGVLERGTDIDVFSLVAGNGRAVLTVSPWRVINGVTRGGNADLRAELRDAAGALVATGDPADRTAATVDVVLTEGAYYLHIRNAGTGDPLAASPTGYPAYGSLGQYFITGQLVPSGVMLPPVAELRAGDLTRNGLSEWEVDVAYTDDLGVDASTFDNADLRVTGPGGYDRPARFVRADVPGNGTPRTVTYGIPAPNGVLWQDEDNGIYTVFLEPDQILDTGGTAAVDGRLGGFAVAIPSAIYAASMDADPGWELEGQWQYGVPAYPGPGPDRGRTGERILGYNLSGNYPNRLAETRATTPAIDASGAAALTLRFQRWLRLRNGDTASIEVSTNRSDWSVVWSTRRTVSDNAWREIQIALPAWTDGAPSLYLRWGLASGASQNDIGWNLDDIEVLSGGTLDTDPPRASFSAADVTLPGAATHSFSVTYEDDFAVAVSTLGAEDLAVLDPGGNSVPVVLEAIDPPGDGSPRTATYSITAPGGAWDPADNGIYTVSLMDGEVGDTANNLAPGSLLGTFTVAIPVDPVSLVVTPTILPVPEGGEAVFRVRANRQPPGAIGIDIRRIDGDADLSIVDPGPFFVDASNWAEGFTVAVRAAVDPDADEGSATFEFAAVDRPPVTALAQEVELPASVRLVVSVSQPDWGSVNPSGGLFPSGTEVEIVATPAAYFRFDGWAGAVSGAENPLRLVLDSDTVLEGRFGELMTTNHPTPLWWLASVGVLSGFEEAVDRVGGNGYAYWESYIAGLDPEDPGSRLDLRMLPPGPGMPPVLEWSPVGGRRYTLLTAAGPDGPFEPVEGAVDLTAEVSRHPLEAPAGNTVRLFRLQVTKP